MSAEVKQVMTEVCYVVSHQTVCMTLPMTNDSFCDNYMLTDLCDKFTQYLFIPNQIIMT